MSASPLSFLRAGPPPPKVVLLPDGVFFNRSVPIAPGATPADAATQVELGLEAISPFPLAQLYYGWYWVPGADHAFVYATYRRRFTVDQTSAWGDAELVAPASAAMFGVTVQPATTLLLGSPEGITAIHWDTPQVPSKVLFRPVEPEASEELRAAAREDILRAVGGSKAVVDLLVPPAPDPAQSDREIVFRSGDFVSRLPIAAAHALDIRDKGELAALRASRKRDVVLWRVTLGMAAALLLLALAELALVGGRAWQQVRVTEVNSRAPAVQKIRDAAELSASIQKLVTDRFLPLEMVTVILGEKAERKPGEITITRVHSSASAATRGSYQLELRLQTSNPAQVPVYRGELEKLPEVEQVVVEAIGSQGGRQEFRLIVIFKPGTLTPQRA